MPHPFNWNKSPYFISENLLPPLKTPYDAGSAFLAPSPFLQSFNLPFLPYNLSDFYSSLSLKQVNDQLMATSALQLLLQSTWVYQVLSKCLQN